MKRPDLFRNRKMIGIFCIVTAILFSVLVAVVTNITGATTYVIEVSPKVPGGTITANTQITKSMIQRVRVGRVNLPKDVIKDASKVIGKYAAIDLSEEDMLTDSKLSTTSSLYSLTDGQLLISVPVKNFADGLSGKLQPGDVVTVFILPSGQSITSSNTTATAQAQVPPELQYVEVAAVTASDGGDTDAATVKKEASSNANNNSSLPATVTLLINQRQGQILASQKDNGVILALAGRGASAKPLLQLQAAYFSQGSSSTSSTTESATSSTAPESPKPGSSSAVSGSSAHNSSSSSAPVQSSSSQSESIPAAGNNGSSSSSGTPSINWGVSK